MILYQSHAVRKMLISWHCVYFEQNVPNFVHGMAWLNLIICALSYSSNYVLWLLARLYFHQACTLLSVKLLYNYACSCLSLVWLADPLPSFSWGRGKERVWSHPHHLLVQLECLHSCLCNQASLISPRLSANASLSAYGSDPQIFKRSEYQDY